jgi:diaminopimelate epimerase
MGVPRFGWRDIPLARELDTKSFDIPGLAKDVSAVNVGNPHCVLFVEDAEKADVKTLGPAIEIHPLFLKRTNVEFVSPFGPARLRMRVWERGVGVTLACGTGACAAIAAAQRRGLCGDKVSIVLDGGVLTLEWPGDGLSVYMTGPTATAFRGEIDL